MHFFLQARARVALQRFHWDLHHPRLTRIGLAEQSTLCLDANLTCLFSVVDAVLFHHFMVPFQALPDVVRLPAYLGQPAEGARLRVSRLGRTHAARSAELRVQDTTADTAE